LARENPHSISFVTALAAAAVYEKRTGNREAAKIYATALLTLLTADDLASAKYPVLCHMTIVNKLLEIWVMETFAPCNRFAERANKWRSEVKQLQEHFWRPQMRAKDPNAIYTASALPQTPSVLCLNRPFLVRLYMLVHILNLWKHDLYAIACFMDEIKCPAHGGHCVRDASEMRTYKDLPSFALLQVGAHLVADKLELPIGIRVNPADTLEFVEPTLMLRPDSQHRVCQALFSWVTGDNYGSIWLGEGTFDGSTLEILAARERSRR
jgi:hypothetical protein